MEFPATGYLRRRASGVRPLTSGVRLQESDQDFGVGIAQKIRDVILSGGEAGARDLTSVYGFGDVDRSTYGVGDLAIFSTASALHDFVWSFGGLSPSSG